MATKNGRSSTHSSHGRSGSHSRSSSGSHKARGSSSSAKSSKSHPSSSRSSSSKRSGSKKSSSSTGVRGKASKIASKVGGTIKQHPVLTAVGAGAGLLIAEGVRRAISGSGSSKSRKSRSSEEDDDEDAGAEDSYETSDESDEDDGDEESEDDEDDSSRRGGVMGSARQGFDRGREIASAGWQKYPLLVCGLAIGLGAVAGMVLPSSSLEDHTLGPAAGKIAKKLKSAGKMVKELASKAYEEAASTVSQEAERVGITPHRLGRKVKHVAVKVRDAVTDAVQG